MLHSVSSLLSWWGRHGLDLVVRLDAMVPNVNPNRPPDSAELVAFEKILERRDSRGVRLAVSFGSRAICGVVAVFEEERASDSRDAHTATHHSDGRLTAVRFSPSTTFFSRWRW